MGVVRWAFFGGFWGFLILFFGGDVWVCDGMAGWCFWDLIVGPSHFSVELLG